MQEMQEIWSRIESWFQRHAPEALNNLRKGASDEDIRQLEIDLGYQLPEDVRASLRLHNGTVDTFADIWQLLSLEGMKEQYQVQIQVLHSLQEDTDEENQDDEIWWWLPSWLPIAYDGSGDLLCVDVTSQTRHQFGQIMFFDHEVGSSRIAPGFHALLSKFADDLEAGKYRLDEYGRLRSKQFLFTRPQIPPDSTPDTP